jgi:NADH-quinone oxidoreductase subunit K
MHLIYPVVIAASLFSVGVYGVLARRNAILVLMSVELMLNAVNLNLVVFDMRWADRLHGGQVLTLFVIVLAAAEVGIGLAIILQFYRLRRAIAIDDIPLHEADDQDREAVDQAGDQEEQEEQKEQDHRQVTT